MKTMNIFKGLALAILMPALMLAASCNKNEEAPKTKGYKMPVTVNVTRVGDESATRASYDSGTRKLSFSYGDQLFVSGKTAAVTFAGILDYDDVTEKFSGDLEMDNEYTGTVEEMFTEASSGGVFSANHIEAVLLPDEWQYSYFWNYHESSYNSFFDAPDYRYAVASDLATAVEQYSLEKATTYSGGFALAPQNAIVNCSYKLSGEVNVTTCKPYLFEDGIKKYGSNVEVYFGEEDIINFAIAVKDDQNAHFYVLKDNNESPIINVNLGDKKLKAGHIYNWRNYTPDPSL